MFDDPNAILRLVARDHRLRAVGKAGPRRAIERRADRTVALAVERRLRHLHVAPQLAVVRIAGLEPADVGEVELTTNLIIAASETDDHLTDAEIDEILGVAPHGA